MSPNGRLIASAGFRNVKLWRMSPLEPTTIPRINYDDSLVIGMNTGGTHLATLSRRGELSVAEVGTNRWQWMKSFDVPDALTGSNPPQIHLALGTNAHQAAVAWGNTIRMVRIDAAETETIDSQSMITALLWYDTEQLATADAKGNVIFWRRDEAGWSKTAHDVFDQPVTGLYAAAGDPMRWVAVDVAGKVATWNKASRTFVDAGQLPTPASAAALSSSGESLWITTMEGGLGRYDIVAKQFIEVAKSDPVAEARYARDNWQSLVGERLVATHEQSVKQAETNVAAETKSVETLANEIESKTKQKSDKLASLTDAEQAAEAALTKLDKAKSDEQTQNQLRKDLTESAKQLESEISKLESKLAELRKEHSDTKKGLSEIPDAKKLADVVKAATEAVAKANKTMAERQNELKTVESDLRLAEQTKARGESRLEGLRARA